MNPFETEYHNHTTVHPLGALAVIVLGAALVTLNRRQAVLPLLLVACFIPSAQRIVVAGLDFDFLRVMVLFGLYRILARREYAGFRWTGLDTLIVVWATINALFPMIRFGIGPNIVNRLGSMLDILGMYFMFRVLIGSSEDVQTAIRWTMYLSLPVAAFFFLERATGRNLFAVFGGVPEITKIRDGRLRCQGAFAHPIIAGAFWAALLPLVVCQWRQPEANRVLVAASACASLCIIVLSASSTPVFGVITAVVGGIVFVVRQHLRLLRWAIVFLLIGLHMIMQAPVWHLISRVSAMGGSSWHRFALVDGFITHWDEWWLVGTYVGTGHWGHFTFDVTNYYIVQGITGGLLQFGLWLGIIALGFAYVGRMLVSTEGSTRAELIFIWGIGVSLLVHAVNLFGVSYFGQIWLIWYMLLGGIGSLYAGMLTRAEDLSSLGRTATPMQWKGRQL